MPPVAGFGEGKNCENAKKVVFESMLLDASRRRNGNPGALRTNLVNRSLGERRCIGDTPRRAGGTVADIYIYIYIYTVDGITKIDHPGGGYAPPDPPIKSAFGLRDIPWDFPWNIPWDIPWDIP